MAHPYHHSLSSVKKWGGTIDDYLAIHSWFDASKLITADFRHRALRHHAEGIFLAETFFGPTITTANCWRRDAGRSTSPRITPSMKASHLFCSMVSSIPTSDLRIVRSTGPALDAGPFLFR